MTRAVPYDRQTYNNPNPLTRLAHRARYGTALRLADELLPVGGLVLDFGAGDGSFLHRMRIRRPDIRVLAVEPFMTLRHSDIENRQSLDEVEDGSVDLMVAFEVAEHLPDDVLDMMLGSVRRVLRPGGSAILSAPVMYGPVLPIKVLSKALLHRTRPEYSARELVRGTVGLPVERPDDHTHTHKGFDIRELSRDVERHLTVGRRSNSPFPPLPWWVNSQVFFVAS